MMYLTNISFLHIARKENPGNQSLEKSLINLQVSTVNFQQNVAMISNGKYNLKRLKLIFSLSSRRLSEIRGGLVFIEQWELNVVQQAITDTFVAVVKVDRLRLFGSEGEAVIGAPIDFNTYPNVEITLNDPTRRPYIPG